MKNCIYCGAPLDDDALFCRKCGKKVETSKKCPRCGAEERADSVFCSKCGMRLDAQKAPFVFPIQEGVQTNEHIKIKNIVKKNAIKVVLTAVLLILFYWLWQSSLFKSTPKMNFAIQNVDSTAHRRTRSTSQSPYRDRSISQSPYRDRNISQSPYRDQCAAITLKGTRCSRKASSGSIYCWQHK